MTEAKDWSPLGRRFARKALKKFFENKYRYLELCGCNELNTGKSCQECLAQQVKSIVDDFVQKEAITPESKIELPVTSEEKEQFNQSAHAFIERSLKRNLQTGALFQRSGGDALITNPGEAYDAGLQTGQDTVAELAKTKPESSNDELYSEAIELAKDNAPNIHSMIEEYFQKGLSVAVRTYLDKRLDSLTDLTTEKISSSHREYRVARYEKTANIKLF